MFQGLSLPSLQKPLSMTATVFSPTTDGVIAALLAPFFMSLGFFIWDVKWSVSNGSAFALNMFKCNIASIWFAIMASIRGFAHDESAQVFTVTSVGYLALSSTLGIIIGDVLWLEALRLLGAKHVIVLDSLKPFAAAILGRFLLSEALHSLGYMGMALTVLGVGIVAWEGQSNLLNDGKTEEKEQSVGDIEIELHNTEEPPQVNDGVTPVAVAADAHKSDSLQINLKEYKRGYFCAILNVLADSFGSLLTKQHAVGMTTWTINLIRFGFAGVILIFVSIGMRLHQRCLVSNDGGEAKTDNAAISTTSHIDNTGNTVHESDTANDTKRNNSMPRWFEFPTLTTKGWLQITLGVAFVTFLCPALEKFALMQIALGLSISLASIGPLYGVSMDWLFKGRRQTAVGIVGAVFAVGGIIVLCAYGI